MARRPTLPLDDDPLDIILTRKENRSETNFGINRNEGSNVSLRNNYVNDDNVSNKSKSKKKVRVAFHLPDRLAEEARNCVYHLSGPPLRLTMAELAKRGITAEIDRLKAEYNNDQPFPQRREDLKGGRPIR
jgi:hypothetical protein